MLYVVCRFYPADLPFWLPWEFSWPEFLATALTLAWFCARAEDPARSPASAAVAADLFRRGRGQSFYIVLQTHIDYYAQHMFFVHRWAHFVLHHAGRLPDRHGHERAGAVCRACRISSSPWSTARPVQATLDVPAASGDGAVAVRGAALFLADPRRSIPV